MMATQNDPITPDMARELIEMALHTQAHELTLLSRKRSYIGPQHAENRATLRRSAKRCTELAHYVAATEPTFLASVLGLPGWR